MPSKGKPPVDPSIKNASSSSDNDNGGGGGESTHNSISSSTIKSAYVNFLSSYENMVRQQDHEYDVTTKHLRGVFTRVQYLGRSGSSSNQKAAPQDHEGEGALLLLTYNQIRRCLLRLGITWKRSMPTLIDDDDDGSTDTSLNSSSVTSLGTGSGRMKKKKRDIITTDAQLIMLLTSLVEAEERYRADNKKVEVDFGSEERSDVGKKYFYSKGGISFPEFIQCYQLIVSGMQLLQTLNSNNGGDYDHDDDQIAKENIINRVKERTFGLLRPFGPDVDLYKEERSVEAKSIHNNSGGEGLNDHDVRTLIRSKDAALVMIMQDHEFEMDAMAISMEALRSKHKRTRKLMRLRRGLLTVGTLILCVGLLTTIIIRENQRRVEVAEGVISMREAERRTNEKTIAKLLEKKNALGTKVGDTEGKMRYLVDRNKGIDAETKELETKLESVDLKYWIDTTELQRCVAERKELGEALTEESVKKEAMEEELGWCQSRSRLIEKQINTLDNASSVHEGGEEVDDDGIMEGDKTLHLNIKYNKSMRHAMTVRQAYSAATGLVVSTMIHHLLPIIIKLFAPKPVQIIIAEAIPKNRSLPPWSKRFLPPWSKRNKRAESAVVDGIFGGSITFLVIRAIALFLFP